MSKFRTIYALTTISDSYKPRYIGTTKTEPAKRLYHHISRTLRGSKLPVHCWILSRIKRNEEILILKLEDGFFEAEIEKFWISNFKNLGFELLNVTEGGDGCGRDGPLDQSHRDAISKGLLASGRSYTEQAKKTAAALLGRKLSPEHVKSLKSAKRPKWTEERRLAVAITNASKETKEKRRIAAINRSNSEESRKALSERGKLGAQSRWNKAT